jgi:hypothetical protein
MGASDSDALFLSHFRKTEAQIGECDVTSLGDRDKQNTAYEFTYPTQDG